MKTLKSISKVVFDFFEIYLPSASFMFLFISYCVMILYRYLLHKQLNWVYELSTIAFVWTVVFSASYGGRKTEHIMFTILYDKLTLRQQRIMRIVSNFIIVIMFSILFPYVLYSVDFLSIKKSSLLKIPFNIIYSPFVFFTAFTVIHHAVKLIKDIRDNTELFKGVN